MTVNRIIRTGTVNLGNKCHSRRIVLSSSLCFAPTDKSPFAATALCACSVNIIYICSYNYIINSFGSSIAIECYITGPFGIQVCICSKCSTCCSSSSKTFVSVPPSECATCFSRCWQSAWQSRLTTCITWATRCRTITMVSYGITRRFLEKIYTTIACPIVTFYAIFIGSHIMSLV